MPTTRLAAILFTDIVGYTAMMQQNREQAMHAVRFYESHLKDKIAQHEGELLQTYGDGSLSIFDSASAAVLCAKELQEAIRGEVSLRIGIHLGEVTIDGEHIFGDGVNIASRVESMGVAGAVLVSSSIRQQIKNKPEFELSSLGKYAFKNVAEPMTVYALATEGLVVPDANAMQGKGKKVTEEKVPARNWLRMASTGFVAMAIGAAIFWAVASGNPDGQLPETITEQRVAILPFNNRTTDSNLEVFGAFCSDLITNGLTEVGIKTCSPRTVEQYNHLIGILPDNPEGQSSFSEVVGARYWVEGYFSLVGDTLTIQSHLTDGSNGDIVRNFPEIKGHIDKKEDLVDELALRLMSYWVAREEIDRGKFKPPTYEAFQEYRKIFTASKSGLFARKYGLTAFALDTSFYLAALETMFHLADSRSPRYDSVRNLLGPHYDKMTNYEQLRFDAYEALYERDYPNYVKYNEALYRLFPQDLAQTSYYAFHLALRENKPLKAWEVYRAIDWKSLSEELHEFRKTRMWPIGFIGLGAKKYQEAIDLMDSYNPDGGPNFMLKSLVYSRTNQRDSLYVLVNKLRNSEKLMRLYPFSFGSGHPEYNLLHFCNDVGQEFLLQEQSEEAEQFLQIAIDWITEKPERLHNIYDSLELARTWRLMGMPEKSLPLEEALVSSYIQDDRRVSYLARQFYFSGIGIDYVLLGQKEKSREIIANFRGNGWGLYAKARVHAVLGEKEEAMRLLERWKANHGHSYMSCYVLKYDYFMKDMFGYEPFEEFVRVRD